MSVVVVCKTTARNRKEVLCMADTFGIFRVQKLSQGRAGGSLATSWKHQARHDEVADISHPERTHLNYTKVSPTCEGLTPSQIAKKILGKHQQATGRKYRSDGSVAVEMLFSHSPGADVNMKEFENRIFNFIKSEFPSMKLLRVDRHCDESSDHWHVIGTMTQNGRITIAKDLGGPAEFRKHQDRFAEFVADLGLKRGIPKSKTGKRHRTKMQWEQQQKQDRETAQILHDIFER